MSAYDFIKVAIDGRNLKKVESGEVCNSVVDGYCFNSEKEASEYVNRKSIIHLSLSSVIWALITGIMIGMFLVYVQELLLSEQGRFWMIMFPLVILFILYYWFRIKANWYGREYFIIKSGEREGLK